MKANKSKIFTDYLTGQMTEIDTEIEANRQKIAALINELTPLRDRQSYLMEVRANMQDLVKSKKQKDGPIQST